MKISIIAAIDEKRGLGKNNQLLFKIPEDFKRMKVLTTGHPIIMGRKTFESIGRPLPNRTNIVITRNNSLPGSHLRAHLGAPGGEIVVVHSLEDALEHAKNVILKTKSEESKTRSFANAQDDNKEGEIFVFGGGQIFTQALPFADKLYLTLVKGDYGADAFFPDYSMFKTVINKEEHQSGDYSFTFIDLEK